MEFDFKKIKDSKKVQDFFELVSPVYDNLKDGYEEIKKDTLPSTIRGWTMFIVKRGTSITTGLMLVLHVFLIFMMIHYNVIHLVKFNILSTVIYFVCFLISLFDHTAIPFVMMLFEMPFCAYVSTVYLGWNSGFSQYLIALIPVTVNFGDMIFKGIKKLIAFIFTIAASVMYIWLYTTFYDASPVVSLKPKNLYTLFMVNAILVIILISAFCFIYMIMLSFNNQQLMQRNEKLKKEMIKDPLTMLTNRRGFLPIVKKLITEKKKFSVAFCDIDNFKHINDTYGHDAGDEVLRRVTKIIKKEAKNCEVCRWGGEEIVLLMKGYDINNAAKKMEYIRKLVEHNPTKFYKKQIPATITIGVEEYKPKYKTADNIIKVADNRMYYGKQHGKNKVIYKDMTKENNKNTPPQ